MEKYSLVVQWSEEDKGYIATIPEFEGLSAFGDTKEEALKELEIAKEAYLEVFSEDGCPLPKPDTLNSFSGQIRLRMPKSLHASLSREAKKEGVSLNTYINFLLSKRNTEQRIERKIDNIEEDIQNLSNQQIVYYYPSHTGYTEYPQYQITVTGAEREYERFESFSYGDLESTDYDEQRVH